MRAGILLFVAAVGAVWAAGTFRSDRVSLNGEWKFELRRDNPLTTTGPVAFGPLRASSQALLLSVQGTHKITRWNTSVPWPLAGTLLGASAPAWGQRQIWRPHPKQEGPTWWEADLGNLQTVSSVQIEWASKDRPAVTVALAAKKDEWETWASVKPSGDVPRTIISGAPKEARTVRLTFEPAQFDGTGRIEIFTRDRRDGTDRVWQPRLLREWYDSLRNFRTGSEFSKAAFDDSGWKTIRVPGYWEAQGFSSPTWWQPDETVGYYRRWFPVPSAWSNRNVRLRFEGANNGARVWLNGRELGYHESGFTSFEYDVTPYLRHGEPNLLAVRVAKWTLTHEYDTDDQWFLGGLWRDVYLYSLPQARIDDYHVTTTFDKGYQDGVLHVSATVAGLQTGDATVEAVLADAAGVQTATFSSAPMPAAAGAQAVTISSMIKAPRKWTAETPDLYSLELRLKQRGAVLHSVRLPVGFRQVEVRGHSLLLNGKPLKIRGVVTTRANPYDSSEPPAEVFGRELRLLKESNINAIRSHTVQLEDEFLDLCDKHGIYVVPDVPNVWVNEADFQPLAEGVVDRAREVFARHKNRPSVIAWHVGNENGQSTYFRGSAQAARYLRDVDPTRPVAICNNRASADELGTNFTDVHYRPMTRRDFTNDFGPPVLFGEFHAIPEEVGRLKDSGFVETWGRSLALEWAEFEKRPWSAGGLICCWEDGAVNGDLGPNQWGVVDGKRQPKPVLPYIRRVFAPVDVKTGEIKVEAGKLSANLTIRNKYTFIDTSGMRIVWKVIGGRASSLSSGELKAVVDPGASTSVPFAASIPKDSEAVRIEVFDRDGYSIADETVYFAAPERPVLSTGAPVKAAPQVRTPRYKLKLDAAGRIVILDAKGRELLSVEDLVIRTGKRLREKLGDVHAGRFTYSGSTATAQLTLTSVATTMKGTLTVEPMVNAIRVAYRLTPDKAVTISQAGLRISRSAGLARLHTGRRVVPLADATTGDTRRGLESLLLEGNAASVAIAPQGSSMDVEFEERGLLVSDYIGAGDFLGKFDTDTIEKTIGPDSVLEGGFTLYVQDPAVRARR